MKIYLASTSQYRKYLLQKFGVTVEVIEPMVDEERLKTSNPQLMQNQLAEFLSFKKGESVLEKLTSHHDSQMTESYVVISGDQLVSFQGRIVGKPLTRENAISQLEEMNGQSHDLITSVSFFKDGSCKNYTNVTKLKMRQLTKTEIANYVNLDSPLDCAGSYKIESKGICLFDSIETDDFSAIQGLPLMWIGRKLKELGYEFFQK